MIPVIGTAVVNSSYWVSRLLMSVDFPVENFFIINNNGRGELTVDLDNLKLIKHKYIKNINVVHMPSNIGVSCSWNLIIKCYILKPYWLICNDDVSFGPGFLEELYNVSLDEEVGMIHGNKGDFENVGSWDIFMIRDSVVKKYGLFDENLYPAYCEDADYLMRIFNNPTTKRILNLNSNYYHGNGNKTQYYEEGSQTAKTDPSLKPKLDICNLLNIQYLTSKWGEGWRTCNPDPLPFHSLPLNTTTFDIDFIRAKHLGF